MVNHRSIWYPRDIGPRILACGGGMSTCPPTEPTACPPTQRKNPPTTGGQPIDPRDQPTNRLGLPTHPLEFTHAPTNGHRNLPTIRVYLSNPPSESSQNTVPLPTKRPLIIPHHANLAPTCPLAHVPSAVIMTHLSKHWDPSL